MKINLAVVATALLACALSAAALPRQAPAEAAAALDKQSHASLGVSLRSLSFLFDARPGLYLLKDSLVQQGSWQHLLDLKRAGYILIRSLPSADGELVALELTLKGKQVVGALGK